MRLDSITSISTFHILCSSQDGMSASVDVLVDVIRISDGAVLRSAVHPTVAGTLACAWNRHLYNCGPYCEVRTSIARVGDAE